MTWCSVGIYVPSSSIDHNILGRKPGEWKPLEMVRVSRSGSRFIATPEILRTKGTHLVGACSVCVCVCASVYIVRSYIIVRCVENTCIIITWTLLRNLMLLCYFFFFVFRWFMYCTAAGPADPRDPDVLPTNVTFSFRRQWITEKRKKERTETIRWQRCARY